MRAVATLIAALAVASSATAQVAERKTLTLDGAKRLAGYAVAAARQAGAGGVYAVVDEGGHLLYLERLDGTFAAGAAVAQGKARTAALFQKPTGFFEKLVNDGRTAMVTVDFTPLQGGVPVVVDGQVIGAIGVSGAKSAAQDEELAQAAVAAFGAALAGGETVTYLERATVDAAFRRGEPLLETGEYKIHASRREAPGVPEVHTAETDIIYVLDGSATFVTGGTLVDGQPTAPEEVRGRDIQDGTVRTIARGDVLVVPAGTPHWFKEVAGPVTYYVVKAR